MVFLTFHLLTCLVLMNGISDVLVMDRIDKKEEIDRELN